MKFVYLIQSLENSTYKIGVSNNPEKRIIALQTGNSSKLRLVDKFETDMAYKIERILQRRYSHLHKKGEWYQMTIENEIMFKPECQKIHESLKLIKKNDDVFI